MSKPADTGYLRSAAAGLLTDRHHAAAMLAAAEELEALRAAVASWQALDVVEALRYSPIALASPRNGRGPTHDSLGHTPETDDPWATDETSFFQLSP